MDFERVENQQLATDMQAFQGQLQFDSTVLIMSRVPFELRDRRFASQVIENMEAGITYEYVFRANPLRTQSYARLVFMLVTVGIDGNTDTELKANMANKDKKKVTDNINKMMGHLDICFISDEPSIELCIHNAAESKAECYLKVPGKDMFVAWSQGEDAMQIRDQQRKLMVDSSCSDDPIFTLTKLLNTEQGRQFKNNLRKDLKSLINEVFHEQIDALCFGNGN